MPHIQIADAIVQYGRESLEKASLRLLLLVISGRLTCETPATHRPLR